MGASRKSVNFQHGRYQAIGEAMDTNLCSQEKDLHPQKEIRHGLQQASQTIYGASQHNQADSTKKQHGDYQVDQGDVCHLALGSGSGAKSGYCSNR